MPKEPLFYIISGIAFLSLVGSFCPVYELYIRTKNSEGIFIFYAALALSLVFILLVYLRPKKK